MIQKVKMLILPFGGSNNEWYTHLEDAEFWGSLFSVLLYSIFILFGQFKVVSWVFWIWFVGSFLIWILSRFLGLQFSYSQILSTIGYCITPLTLTVILYGFLPKLIEKNLINFGIKLVATLWSSYSCSKFIMSHQENEISNDGKKMMLIYPIWLMYIYFITFHSGL